MTRESPSRCRTATTGGFNNILAVNAKLVSILSLKASNVVRYVNAPVIGFDSTNTITSIASVAKF